MTKMISYSTLASSEENRSEPCAMPLIARLIVIGDSRMSYQPLSIDRAVRATIGTTPLTALKILLDP